MITKQDILYAYKLILGREPENSDVIESHLNTLHTLEELRLEFIGSPEFASQMTKYLGTPSFVRHRHPFDLAKIEVDTVANDEQMKQMFNRLCDCWEKLGYVEPYWSVLTQPQYKLENFQEFTEQFYQSGGPLYRIFLAALHRNNFKVSDFKVCLELGCGVGRMTRLLASDFDKVVAAEVSGQHLQMAKNYLSIQDVGNVEYFHINTLDKINELPEFDLILSVITLQHNPPPIIELFLRNILISLKPGGVAFIQIPTYRKDYFFGTEAYLNEPGSNEIEMHFLPQEKIFKIIETAQCRCLEIREDSMIGNEDLMLSNSFLIYKD